MQLASVEVQVCRHAVAVFVQVDAQSGFGPTSGWATSGWATSS
jgi:hypothetical protein